MDVRTMQKPTFGRDQIVSATMASKKFSEVRKRAKRSPQFISDHNQIDTVLLDYQTYEDMYAELAYLREKNFYEVAAKRIEEGDRDLSRKRVDLKDVMEKEDYACYQDVDPDVIADEDLFE